MDISVKIGIGLGSAFMGAAAIIVPDTRQKDAAALDLFERPFKQLTPQEAKVAEFRAGHKRWEDFFQQKVYPITRKFPGAQNPIVNPFKEDQVPARQQDEQEQEQEAGRGGRRVKGK